MACNTCNSGVNPTTYTSYENGSGSHGFLIIIVLYILLAIILGSICNAY